jgi:hypothetical protein
MVQWINSRIILLKFKLSVEGGPFTRLVYTCVNYTIRVFNTESVSGLRFKQDLSYINLRIHTFLLLLLV